MGKSRNEGSSMNSPEDPAPGPMAHKYHKHYTREEARALLPKIRRWLGAINQLRAEVQQREQRLQESMVAGQDVGGDLVNNWVRALARVKDVLVEFEAREI